MINKQNCLISLVSLLSSFPILSIKRFFGKKTNTLTSIKNRFRPVANNKFKYNSECHNHNLAKKTCSQQAVIRQTQITEGWQTKKIKKYI